MTLAPSADRPLLLSVQGITKAYPGVIANKDVSFAIAKGEIHALLGENGAGKSTLVKMIYGLVKPELRTSAALAMHTRREVDLWKKVIADAGISPN